MTEVAQGIIQIGIGLTMVVFGVHQILKPDKWFEYIPMFLHWLIPSKIERPFMRIHGAINVLLGLLFAIGIWLGVVGWLTLAWWVVIFPFAFLKDWREGMRDLSIIAAVVAVIILK